MTKPASLVLSGVLVVQDRLILPDTGATMSPGQWSTCSDSGGLAKMSYACATSSQPMRTPGSPSLEHDESVTGREPCRLSGVGECMQARLCATVAVAAVAVAAVTRADDV